MNKTSNILWGFVLVIIGIIFGINALGIADINIFFSGWWTLFIIVPCFIDLFKEKDKTGNIIGLVIGVCLLLACNDILAFDILWKLFVPFVLVVIGLSLIFKDGIQGKIKKEIKKLNKSDNKEYYATFSGQEMDFAKEKFDGCNLNAVFGGIKCDLRDAKIDADAVINASAIFGAVTIYTPLNVNVKVVSTSIFGGATNERKSKDKDHEITLYINATCMFGGVEIK